MQKRRVIGTIPINVTTEFEKAPLPDLCRTILTNKSGGVGVVMEEVKCEQVGMLIGDKWEKMHDIGRRVYSPEGLAPTQHTCGGGNLETKIVVAVDEQNKALRTDGTVGTLTTDGSSPKHNNMSPTIDTRADCLGVVRNYRIRKLTPTECFTLQGVKPADIKLIQPNQSNSSQYHLAGDSICCSVLVAIFAKMFGKDSTQAVNDYLKDIFGGENGREQTPLSCELETNKSRAETHRKNNCKKL